MLPMRPGTKGVGLLGCLELLVLLILKVCILLGLSHAAVGLLLLLWRFPCLVGLRHQGALWRSTVWVISIFVFLLLLYGSVIIVLITVLAPSTFVCVLKVTWSVELFWCCDHECVHWCRWRRRTHHTIIILQGYYVHLSFVKSLVSRFLSFPY